MLADKIVDIAFIVVGIAGVVLTAVKVLIQC